MRVVAVGVGNPYRSDDGAGIAVAERLRETMTGVVEVVTCEQEPLRLLDAWDGADLAMIVDAVSSGAAPGTVHRFEATEHAVPPSLFRGSTHALGVGDAIELARTLGRLPDRVVVYGIEGERFTAGERLSPAVEDAVQQVATDIGEETRCTSVR